VCDEGKKFYNIDTRTKEFAEAKAKSAACKGGISADKDVKAAIMAQYAQVRLSVISKSFDRFLVKTNAVLKCHSA